MGTLGDKFSYLIATKNLMKTVLRNKGQSVSDDATFRSYVDKINNLVPPPSGTINVTQNGITDVTDYVSANVNVQPNLQNKSVEITTNTTTNISADSGYDGLGQVSVTTNIPTININDYEVNTITQNPISGGYPGSLQILKRLPPDFNIDSSITDGTGLFRYLKNLVEIPNTLDTKNLNRINNMCLGCSSLVNVPILNFKGITGANATTIAFKNCPSLTDNSLNNIMQSLLSITEAYTGTRTLKFIGLTEEQATRCQSLSNYQALIEAGWTTGY